MLFYLLCWPDGIMRWVTRERVKKMMVLVVVYDDLMVYGNDKNVVWSIKKIRSFFATEWLMLFAGRSWWHSAVVYHVVAEKITLWEILEWNTYVYKNNLVIHDARWVFIWMHACMHHYACMWWAEKKVR